MTLEKGSLILLDYTAKIKDTNEIFETTRENDVKSSEDFDPSRKYEPRLLGVGEGWVLKGLDDALLSANLGEPLNIEIPPEKAFGERDPSKVRMIPLRKLGEKANEVGVGDVIELDERMGIIRFIGSGRVQVDFNHKYAGRTLLYDANIVKKIESEDEKITNLIRRRLPVDTNDLNYATKDSELEIIIPEKIFLLDGLQIIKRGIVGDIFKFVPTLQNINFIEKYPNSSNTTTPKNSDTDTKTDNVNGNSSNNKESQKNKVESNDTSSSVTKEAESKKNNK
ncbi:MAG: FKBP-type peptidyl-prolyl cis-trans isomerase [Nitrosopumilus sp.]|nr:FKBP-type peptidyl-prolyl cis-trans isomerase [Nitrosopumilus sp.]